MYLKLIKEHRKIATCNQLDLETLGNGLPPWTLLEGVVLSDL